MPAIVIAIFLAAHGLVHASYAQTPPPAKGTGPGWPFYLDHSWLLTPLGLGGATTRVIGLLLIAAVVAGYAVAALAVLGIAPGSWFLPAVVGASVVSAAMLVLFFTPWILAGLGIDAALVISVVAANWRPGAAL